MVQALQTLRAAVGAAVCLARVERQLRAWVERLAQITAALVAMITQTQPQIYPFKVVALVAVARLQQGRSLVGLRSSGQAAAAVAVTKTGQR
jgi:hypothetical protein